MNVSAEARAERGTPDRSALVLSGGLLLVGLVVNAIQRPLLHPTGAEDDHEAIFTEYAASDVWVFTHFVEFILVLMALAGLLVLCRALRPGTPYLALLAAAATIATAGAWAVLQGVDGITLKQNVDAWAAASGTEEATAFASAETVRWVEWGLQSYFRLLLGAAFVLVGAALLRGRLAPRWLGALALLAGVLSLAIGFSVGYSGLEGGFQDAISYPLQLVVLVFAIGLFAVGLRRRDASPPARHRATGRRARAVPGRHAEP